MGEEGYIYVGEPYINGQPTEALDITSTIKITEANTYCSVLINHGDEDDNDEGDVSHAGSIDHGSVVGHVVVEEDIFELKRFERLKRDILRKKMARSKETPEQRDERLKKDRMRKKQARLQETIEQRKKRLEKDRLRIQQRRASESDDARRKRLERNRVSKRIAREKETSSGNTSDNSSTNHSHSMEMGDYNVN